MAEEKTKQKQKQPRSTAARSNKRARNKEKNERLRARGEHVKQLRAAKNQELHELKHRYGGLDAKERRQLAALNIDYVAAFAHLHTEHERLREAYALRNKIEMARG